MMKAVAIRRLGFWPAACGAVVSEPRSASPSAVAALTPAASTAIPGTTASPSTGTAGSAGASSYGVLVDLLTAPSLYNANVVGVDGRLWASIRLDKRTPISNASGRAIVLPYVSTSLTALYMLVGDSTVLSLRRPDGKQAVVTHLQGGANMEAAFAVSPYDSQIAVSVLDFNRSPVHVQLYTDKLGGGNRHVIFESDSDYVWPVASHSGLLVLSHAY